MRWVRKIIIQHVAHKFISDMCGSASLNKLCRAYVLLILGGFIGAHRAYLGHYLTAFLYMLLFVAGITVFQPLLILLVVLIIEDSITLPTLIDKADAIHRHHCKLDESYEALMAALRERNANRADRVHEKFNRTA